MSNPLEQETLVVKAYARLKGMRENVPDDTYAPRVMFSDFNRALDDLARAGFDLSDDRIADDEVEDIYGVLSVQSSVLRARIDAVLIYFRIDQDPEKKGPVRARIGFQAPQK